MYPHLANSNPEAIRRIQALAARDPAFLVALIGSLTEAVKFNIAARHPEQIEGVISDFRKVTLEPFALIPLDQLPNELAQHVTNRRMAAAIEEFDMVEAALFLFMLQLYYADERNHPGRPFNLEAYSPFFAISGIDQE